LIVTSTNEIALKTLVDLLAYEPEYSIALQL
jgi:hypothetical protein